MSSIEKYNKDRDRIERYAEQKGITMSEIPIKIKVGDMVYEGMVKAVVPQAVSRAQAAQGESKSEVRDPLARSIADLVTPKQLGMIHALARNVGVDKDAECVAVMKCETTDLSKRAASSFIDHLKKLEEIAKQATGTNGNASQRGPIIDDDIPF